LPHSEQLKKSSTSGASEFRLLKRAIVIFIGGLEELHDCGLKLVLIERAVFILVGLSERLKK
jgi:hypothetical protein